MAKLSKRVVDAAEARDKDYVIWDDELPGFGLRQCSSKPAVSAPTPKPGTSEVHWGSS